MGINEIKKRAVFLDRDGVLNKAVIRAGKPYPPAGIKDVEIYAGVEEGLTRLRQAGYLLIVVTNQPDVARGSQTRQNVEAIHDYMKGILPIDDFMVCFHDDRDQCRCRKPAPGLLLEAAKRENINLASSYMVGDRWRDVEAGQRAGCKSIFIDYGYSETQPKAPDFHVTSFSEAVEIILDEKKS